MSPHHRTVSGVLILCGLLAACSASPDAAGEVSEGRQAVIPTADLAERGLTAEDFPRVQEIAEGVYVYEAVKGNGGEDRIRASQGLPPVRFTVNSMFVVTSDGVLLADGQPSPMMTQRLLEEIAKVTDQPVTHLVIGSDKYSQTGGNSRLPKNMRVFAHPVSAAALQARPKAMESELSPECFEIGGPSCPGNQVMPTDLVTGTTALHLGDMDIHVMFLGRARSGGDLLVYLPEQKVLFGSQVFMPGIFPAFSGGYPAEWLRVVEAMQAMDVDVYVPGHGFMDSPQVMEAQLELQRAAMQLVFDEAKRLFEAGVEVEEAIELADFGTGLEGWTLRASQEAPSVRAVYDELSRGASAAAP